MHAFKELLEAWPQIELVKIKRFTGLEFISKVHRRLQGTKFQVLAMLPGGFLDKTIG